jgi:hypothetical protein
MRSVVLILTATLILVSLRHVSFSQDYDNTVVLPASGSIDERAFFATRRNPAIDYDRQSNDAVAQLAQKVDDGTLHLRFDKTSGYLLSILEALHIPIESQSVVFSKTSFQAHFISPANPRALFYSDEISVGFIRNATLLEIAVLDAHQGTLFYAVQQQPTERPHIYRSDSCLSCHELHDSLDVPGLLLRSMGVGNEGQTMPELGNFVTDHRSPLEERFGGWFVTGKSGTAPHMGNIMHPAETPAKSAPGKSASAPKMLADLEGQFDPAGYPSQYSDIAAVLVLDHQVRMANLLTRVGWETRIAQDREQKHPEEKDNAERLIASDSRELSDYMLFIDEAPLHGTFESTSGFQKKFESQGPLDSHGRSLRQLDLGKRLLRYPCSYMIYSQAFDGLPTAAKSGVYSRLWDVLSGKDKSARYSKLTAADRSAIIGILLDTKKDLPAYFKTL